MSNAMPLADYAPSQLQGAAMTETAFRCDLLRERVRSGIAAAPKRGVVFGRRPGHGVKADRFAPKVLKFVSERQSYREISRRLGVSKNTVLDIVKRDRAARPTMMIARLGGLTSLPRAPAMSAMVLATGHSKIQSARS